MSKQFAVLGLDRFGESVAITLEQLGCEVIAIDKIEEKIEDIAGKVTYAYVADAGDPDVLQSMGIAAVDGVVVAIAGNMEANIMATMVAKELGVPFIMAVAKNERHKTVLEKIGADTVIFPEQEIGARVARNLMSVNLSDWIALSSEYSIMEIAVPTDWIGKTLRELDIHNKQGVNVVAIRSGEDVEININPDKPMEAGKILILVGANKDLEKI